MSLPYNGKLIPRAKVLRCNMTKQEKKLWYQFLCRYPIRFQRQKTIGHFIVDFFCAKAKMAVEADGSQHYTKAGLAYDKKRSEILLGIGVEVIRFSNREIDHDFLAVCKKIDIEVQRRLNDGG